jgi:hypothetical protein
MAAVRFQVRNEGDQQIVDEIHKIVVHKFDLSDVDDPDIYAAGPMFEWERSEAGQFVFKHAVDAPEWHRHMDPMFMGYRYIITAELEKKKLSEFYLKWGKDGNNSAQR